MNSLSNSFRDLRIVADNARMPELSRTKSADMVRMPLLPTRLRQQRKKNRPRRTVSAPATAAEFIPLSTPITYPTASSRWSTGCIANEKSNSLTPPARPTSRFFVETAGGIQPRLPRRTHDSNQKGGRAIKRLTQGKRVESPRRPSWTIDTVHQERLPGADFCGQIVLV